MPSYGQQRSGYPPHVSFDIDHDRRSPSPRGRPSRSPVKDDRPRRPRSRPQSSHYDPPNKYYVPGDDGRLSRSPGTVDRPSRPQARRHSSHYDPRESYPISGDDGRPSRSPVKDDHPRRPTTRRHSSHYDPRDTYRTPGDDEFDNAYRPSRRHSSASRGRDVAPRKNSPDPRRHRTSLRSNHEQSSGEYRDYDYGQRRRQSNSHVSHINERRPLAPSSARSSSHPPPLRSATEPTPGRHSSRHYPPSTSASKSGASRRSSRRRPSRSSPSPSRSPSPSPEAKSGGAWMGAAKVAMEAGAMAALKMRHDPGEWMGTKGATVATAALGAAVVDAFMDKKFPNRKGGMRHTMAKTATQRALRHMVPGG